MFDHPAHREWPRQQRGRRQRIGGLQRVADAAGGNRAAAVGDRGDDLGSKAVSVAQLCHQRHIAAAALAEGEIIAGDDPCHAQPAGEPICDPVFGAERRQFAGERDDDRAVHAKRLEQVHALRHRGQRERRQIGAEQPRRMRIEGRDERRAALCMGMVARAPDDGLMPGVKAIEIPERDDAASQMCRQRRRVGDPVHGFGSSASLVGLENQRFR